MTLDDYKTIINGIVENPDTAPTASISLLENIAEDLAAFESLKNASDEKDVKIKDLQDTNIKLYLSQTKKEETKPEPEDETEGLEGSDLLKYYAKKIYEKDGGK